MTMKAWEEEELRSCPTGCKFFLARWILAPENVIVSFYSGTQVLFIDAFYESLVTSLR